MVTKELVICVSGLPVYSNFVKKIVFFFSLFTVNVVPVVVVRFGKVINISSFYLFVLFGEDSLKYITVYPLLEKNYYPSERLLPVYRPRL